MTINSQLPNPLRTVIETLKTVDESRKCYRLIGGVLCARTVSKVLPELIDHKDQLELMVSRGNEQLSRKGQEINKYIEVNNIKFKGQEAMIDQKAEPVASDAKRNQILVTQ